MDYTKCLKKYNEIISLVSHCEPSDHYRRYFKKQPCSPFDWMITHFDSILRIFQDDGRSFGDKVSPAYEGASAMCEVYECFYHHEFDKNEENKVIISIDSLNNTKEKLIYKYNKMLEVSREKMPVFIRWPHPSERPKSGEYIFTENDVDSLYCMLKEKLLHEYFHIAFIKTDENLNAIIPRICMEKYENISSYSYTEKDENSKNNFWNNFYNSLGLEEVL